MGKSKKDAKAAAATIRTNRKPLAAQLKQHAQSKSNKRPAAETIVRPYLLSQYDELSKEDRDIVLDRLRKEVVESTTVVPAIKPFIARGVNHVSRLIAKRELRVVVFANNPDVSVGAFGHIPVLCRLHRVPICLVHMSSKAFGAVFHQPSLSVVGIKRLPKRSEDEAPREDASSPTIQEDANNVLPEIAYEKLQSISDFLVAKASSKNHSLQ